jgi:alkylated DNA repair dioxygenase AlkB
MQNADVAKVADAITQNFSAYRIKELPNAEFYYFPDYLGNHQELFEWLINNLPWSQQKGVMYGKTYDEPRRKCIFSTNAGKDYSYGSITATMLPFPEPLEKIRLHLSKTFGIEFDCCIVNLYENGKHYIAAHRDKESSIIPGMPIVSITLGTVRYFDLTSDHPANVPPPPFPAHDKVRLSPISGSVILMARDSQVYYKHAVPKQLTIETARINVTFRVSPK